MTIDPAHAEELHRKLDWRHRAATVLSEGIPERGPGQPSHDEGTPVVLVSMAERKGEKYFFPVPSASAVLVDAAQRAYVEWRTLNPLVTGSPGTDAARFGPVDWFDVARAGFTAVLCGYNAIEGETNDLIPTGRIYERETKKRRKERLDRDQIVASVGLEAKLTQVMPQLAGIPDPSQMPFWSDFAVIQRLRHRIVHLRPADVENWAGSGPTPDTVWARIFDPDLPDPAVVAKQVIQHVSGGQGPRWLRYSPF